MAQNEIEVILTRQLAETLAVPVFLVDPAGDLLFYNEPAERILGLRFQETGAMAASAWATAFTPTDENGTRLGPEDLPLVVTLRDRVHVHRTFWIAGMDGVRRRIGVTSFPLIGQGDRFLGAVAMFWEAE